MRMHLKKTLYISVLVGGLLNPLNSLFASLDKEYKDALKKTNSDRSKELEKCEEMYNNAQWTATDVTNRMYLSAIYNKVGSTKPREISRAPLGRIYIDPKTKEIYEMRRARDLLQGNCYVLGASWNSLLAINKFNRKPRKLNKKFTFTDMKSDRNGKLIASGSKLQPIFKIEGDHLVAYTKLTSGSIARDIWGVRTSFRDPNYTKAFSEPRFSSNGFGELPIRKGDYLLCSNGSEITSKLFIDDPVVPLTPKAVRKRVKVRDPNYKKFRADGTPTFMPEYYYEEQITFVERPHYGKNDKGQVLGFNASSASRPSDLNRNLYFTSSESLYGVKSKLISINLDSMVDENRNVLDKENMTKKLEAYLSSPIQKDKKFLESYDIRRTGQKGNSWSYKYSDNNKNIGKKNVQINGEYGFNLGGYDVGKFQRKIWDLSRVYCLKEKNRFLLRVVEVRNNRQGFEDVRQTPFL